MRRAMLGGVAYEIIGSYFSLLISVFDISNGWL
jgi:hypothetical protein